MTSKSQKAAAASPSLGASFQFSSPRSTTSSASSASLAYYQSISNPNYKISGILKIKKKGSGFWRKQFIALTLNNVLVSFANKVRRDMQSEVIFWELHESFFCLSIEFNQGRPKNDFYRFEGSMRDIDKSR